MDIVPVVSSTILDYSHHVERVSVMEKLYFWSHMSYYTTITVGHLVGPICIVHGNSWSFLPIGLLSRVLEGRRIKSGDILGRSIYFQFSRN